MCLAVYKPANVLPNWEAYEHGFDNNKDGAGFVAAVNGRIEIHKGFFTFDEFKAAFEPYAAAQAAIHFRLATHGNTDHGNCHPFRVSDETAMVHNGILNIDCNVNKEKSDTWHYCELVLAPMAKRDRGFFRRGAIKFMGEAAIKGSKFIFLRADGAHSIWNENDGLWENDQWWSNTSFRVPRYTAGYFAKAFSSSKKKEKASDDWGWDVRDYGKASSESEYYDFLTGEAKWAYDELRDVGFDDYEIDRLYREEGIDAVIATAEETYE
jgi:hypothetical protein